MLSNDVLVSLFARQYDQILQQEMPAHELKCYNLPFGALGFISHVLTYYTIACLWFGRKPLWPFKPITNSKTDLILGFVGISVCIVMSVITMIKCKNTWQLLVIAVWKLSMSLLNGLTGLTVAVMVVSQKEGEVLKSKVAMWWVLLYVPGMMAGMTGLMDLVVKVAPFIPDIMRLTIAFYLVVGAGLIVGVIAMIIICWWGGGAPGKVAATGIAVTLGLFLVLSAFYSDWCLGIMLDNLIGTPSSDASAFYWTYFVAKRLTMFSW
ncbi:hypothetical protein NLJ89_g1651 [Agrocybe chaxingu]|uniref:Uncharacterized protein n=1 Tax=Agrocybe chaxingu TaxID=84603 RepID=A0A9W8TD37_9AGAR|nr:hypothetical protein NLJ89_g1651 [Agrocybe chaxingu]